MTTIEIYKKQIGWITLGACLMWLVLCVIAYADTLGVENNNPINLKYYDNWLGLTGTDQYNHCIFESLEMGIRAGLKNISNHIRKYPNQSLIVYLRAFAEQNSRQEAEYVAFYCKVTVNTAISQIDIVDFFIALARFESGMKLSRKEVLRIKTKYKL